MGSTTESAQSSAKIDVYNPATGEVVGSVTRASAGDVATAVDRARVALRGWRRTSWHDRAQIVRRFHDRLVDDADRVLDTIQRETGKSRRDALAELLTVIGTARYYLAHGHGYIRTERRRGPVPLATSARVVRKPVGVVGFIAPWNYPLLLSIGDTIPALLAGNVFVLKPAELTPMSSELGLALLTECGLPTDVGQIVHGKGSEVGAELTQHVDYVSFTGSTEVGRVVARSAAERLIGCSLELGGKNPMIVLDDAPLDDAVAGLANGSFANSGQACISIERAYVQEGIFDDVAERIAHEVDAMRVGWSLDWDMEMGSLIGAAHADAVERHVSEAVARGATVLVGGGRLRDRGDAFFAPTVLTDVPPDVDLACHETFGPVVALHRVESEYEAIRLANDSPYGLNASVWTGNARRAQEVARHLETGSTVINSTMMIYHAFDVPMGGVKHSGHGRRHARPGIDRFTEPQSIVAGPGFRGGYDSIQRLISNPRRARALLRTFKLMRHIPGAR